jgi:NhaP-type Na+/H+ or K+/H+ antiporter
VTLLVQVVLLLAGAWLLGRLFGLIRLPSVIGMIGAGVVVSALSLSLDAGPTLDDVSTPIRLGILALVLLRAGLGISQGDLRRAGGLGVRLGLVPMVGDAAAVTAAGMWLLGLSFPSALVLGFLVAAISPAIVIPGLLELKSRHGGRSGRILTSLLVGAPLDNIAALIGLGIALDLALSETVVWGEAALSVVLRIGGGVILGVLAGVVCARLRPLRNSLALWAVAIGLVAAGTALDCSFVLAIIALGLVVRATREGEAAAASEGLLRVWNVVQYALFGLIGAAVALEPLVHAGLAIAAVIVLGQLGRAIGSWLATIRSGYRPRERAVFALCYLPKATIQAAFAALPLDRGLPEGELVLGAAVLAVVLMAPIGVITLHRVADRLLSSSHVESKPP